MWEKLNDLRHYEGHFCRECGARYNYPPVYPTCVVCGTPLTHTFRWWLTQFAKTLLIVVGIIILFDLFVFVSP